MAIEKKIIIKVDSQKATEGLNKTSEGLKNVGTSSKGVSKGFKAIGVSMKAMGIGILLGLLAALFEAFKRNQKMQDLVARGMDALQKVVNVVVNVFEFALKVVDKLTFGFLNLAGASNTASASLQQQRNEVRLLEAEEQLITLQYQKRAEELRQVRDDESKTLNQRTEANKQLGNLLTEQREKEIKNAEFSLGVKKRELAQDKNNVDLQIEVTNAKTKIAEIEERITGQRSEMLMNLNSLNREESSGVKILKEKKKTYEELHKEMRKSVGLDKTVEGITMEIAKAHEFHLKKIDLLNNKEEEIEKDRRSRYKKSNKLNKANIEERIKQEQGYLEFAQGQLETIEVGETVVFNHKEQRWEMETTADEERAKKQIDIIQKRIDDLKQLEIDLTEADKKENSKRATNLVAHNEKVDLELKAHLTKKEQAQKEYDDAIRDLRNQASKNLMLFLGTERDRELNQLEIDFKTRYAMVEGQMYEMILLANWFAEQKELINQKHLDKMRAAEDEYDAEQKQSTQELFDLKTSQMERSFAVASSITSSLGQLAEKGTKKQKALAVLGVAIDTAAGISSAIRGATAAAAALPPPAPPIMTPIFIASMIAMVLGGVAQAHSILSKVPGPGGSEPQLQSVTGGINVGGGEGGVPNLPGEGLDMDIPPVQAFVVESDVTSSQALQNDLELQATL
tara:strand:- start:2406 stop:4448 length:2043 start_codon:yes stop_codon:yes gene_type:complete